MPGESQPLTDTWTGVRYAYIPTRVHEPRLSHTCSHQTTALTDAKTDVGYTGSTYPPLSCWTVLVPQTQPFTEPLLLAHEVQRKQL